VSEWGDNGILNGNNKTLEFFSWATVNLWQISSFSHSFLSPWSTLRLLKEHEIYSSEIHFIYQKNGRVRESECEAIWIFSLYSIACILSHPATWWWCYWWKPNIRLLLRIRTVSRCHKVITNIFLFGAEKKSRLSILTVAAFSTHYRFSSLRSKQSRHYRDSTLIFEHHESDILLMW
jgi:hypothetical protein